jgi:hypothetical protein
VRAACAGLGDDAVLAVPVDDFLEPVAGLHNRVNVRAAKTILPSHTCDKFSILGRGMSCSGGSDPVVG